MPMYRPHAPQHLFDEADTKFRQAGWSQMSSEVWVHEAAHKSLHYEERLISPGHGWYLYETGQQQGRRIASEFLDMVQALLG